jgi:hypothetical protein
VFLLEREFTEELKSLREEFKELKRSSRESRTHHQLSSRSIRRRLLPSRKSMANFSELEEEDAILDRT